MAEKIDWSDADWELEGFRRRVLEASTYGTDAFHAMMQRLFVAGLAMPKPVSSGPWTIGPDTPWHETHHPDDLNAAVVTFDGAPFEDVRPHLQRAVTIDDVVLECQLLGTQEEVMAIMCKDDETVGYEERMFARLAVSAPVWLSRALARRDTRKPVARIRTHSAL